MPMPSPGHAEAFSRSIFVTADDDHGTRSHVLLLADNARHTGVAKVSEGFCRMLQQSKRMARLARGHRGRQINQPLGIRSETAHHFQRRDSVLRANGDVAMEACADDALA